MSNGNDGTTVKQAAQQVQRRRVEFAEDTGGADLAIRADQPYWTERQRAALAAVGVSESANVYDLQLFLHVCSSTGLDPFLRQIYLIPRKQWDSAQQREVLKQTIQVGIDGFRKKRIEAEEEGGFVCEFEDTIWYDTDGQERHVWLDTAKPPAACKVVLVKVYPDTTTTTYDEEGRIASQVTRKGQRLRFPAVLVFASYAATKVGGELMAQWNLPPKGQADHMIEKCAEAFASRRACPQRLGGLYIPEEMQGPGQEADQRARATHRTTVRAAAGVATVAEVGGEEPPLAPDPGGGPENPGEAKAGLLRGIMATFSEHGWGGDTEEAQAVRHGVAGVMARADQRADTVVPLARTSDLTLEQAQRVHRGLLSLVRICGEEGASVHDRLGSIGMEAQKVLAEAQRPQRARRQGRGPAKEQRAEGGGQ